MAVLNPRILDWRTGFVGGTASLTEYHRVEPHENILVGSSNVDELFESVADWAYRHAR